jgi:hypothetical protein
VLQAGFRQSAEGRPVSKRTERNNRRPRAEGPSQSSKHMLVLLNLLAAQGKMRLFEGIPPKVKAKRRAKGRMAGQSRKANRHG